MFHRILCPIALAACTLTVGCASDNQNYKINEDDTPMYEEGYPTHPGGAFIDPLPADKTGPSVVGVSRENWTKAYFHPSSGRVPHPPHYFTRDLYGRKWYARDDRPSPLNSSGDHSAMASAVFAESKDSYFDAKDASELVAAPLKFGADMILLPVNATLGERPWSVNSSPDRTEW